MKTLPRSETSTPKNSKANPVESDARKHIRKTPGLAIIPFLPKYLYELPGDTLLLPAEVASLFRVDPKTVTRWAGKPQYGLPNYKTLGGHLRLAVEDVKRVYEKQANPDQAS